MSSLSGNVIATAKIDQLYESVCRMNGVSFGLAGPRGSGKSTAIQYLHDKLNSAGGGSPGPAPSRERAGRPGDYGDPGERGSTGRSRHSSPAPRFFAVVVSAPVSYISRDFILHVFAELCRAIAGPHADELIAPVPSDDKEASSGKRHLIQPIANVVLLAAGAVAAAAATALDPAIARASVPLLAASGAGMAGFVTIMSRPNSRPSRISVRQDWERRRDFLLAIWGAIASSCIAVVGTELHLRLLGRVLWIAGICLFAISALVLPAWSAVEFPRPRNSSARQRAGARISKLGIVLSGVRVAALPPAAAGLIALVSLRFPPKHEVLFYAGCALLVVAAAPLALFSAVKVGESTPPEAAAAAAANSEAAGRRGRSSPGSRAVAPARHPVSGLVPGRGGRVVLAERSWRGFSGGCIPVALACRPDRARACDRSSCGQPVGGRWCHHRAHRPAATSRPARDGYPVLARRPALAAGRNV